MLKESIITITMGVSTTMRMVTVIMRLMDIKKVMDTGMGTVMSLNTIMLLKIKITTMKIVNLRITSCSTSTTKHHGAN
jgi:hypothetical protein